MPFLLSAQISIAAGAYGLIKVIPAALLQRDARKINEKANGLVRNIPAGDREEKVFELEPMMPVLKKGVASGARLGALAVLGTYGMAGFLATAGRRISGASLADRTEKFTVPVILGDGSLAVEALILTGIFVCVAGAVLGTQISKKAEENLRRAYLNLFQAKEMERENRWKNCQVRQEITAMEKKETWTNEPEKECKPEMDVYSLIRSEEIRDYYRKTDACNSLEKKTVLIQHGYISVQKKEALLSQLLGTGTEEENRLVEEMCRVYDRYIEMIYHPAVRTIFLLECNDLWWNEGRTDYASCGLHEAYEFLEEVIAQMEEIYGGEEESARARVAVLQVPQEGRAKIAFRFDMFWIDGKWEIQKFDVDDGKLALQGISDDAIEFFSYTGGRQYHPLPFENGCRLKLRLPFMREPVYGTLESKLDGNGCWHHFLYFDGKEGEANGMADLTNAEIDLTSGYSSIDWIERA